MSVTVDNYTELVRIGCQTMPNSFKTRSQQVNTQEKGVQYPRAFQKRQTLKKKSGFVDRVYNTSKKWLAFFLHVKSICGIPRCEKWENIVILAIFLQTTAHSLIIKLWGLGS